MQIRFNKIKSFKICFCQIKKLEHWFSKFWEYVSDIVPNKSQILSQEDKQHKKNKQIKKRMIAYKTLKTHK